MKAIHIRAICAQTEDHNSQRERRSSLTPEVLLSRTGGACRQATERRPSLQ